MINTEEDNIGNQLADTHAGLAASAHDLPEGEVAAIQAMDGKA